MTEKEKFTAELDCQEMAYIHGDDIFIEKFFSLIHELKAKLFICDKSDSSFELAYLIGKNIDMTFYYYFNEDNHGMALYFYDEYNLEDYVKRINIDFLSVDEFETIFKSMLGEILMNRIIIENSELKRD